MCSHPIWNRKTVFAGLEDIHASRTDRNVSVKKQPTKKQISDRVNVLERLKSFGRLTQKQLHYASSHLQELSVGPNEVVIRQGEEGKEFYIIEEGLSGSVVPTSPS